ncbi:MAG: tyrosine-type recombinase/integrase [Acidimicrobiales bacterium]
MSARGSVKKDASGRWCFVVDLPSGDKRRQVRRRGFRTQEEAQEVLDELRGSVRAGTFVEPAKTTLGQYLSVWLDGLAVTGKRATTVAGYRQTLGAHVLGSDIAGVPLQALTAADLDGLYAHLATEGRKPRRVAAGAEPKPKGLSLRTVRYIHTIVSKALSDAERKGLIPRNPARLATPPAASATRAPEMTVWTPGELRQFMDATASHHHGTLIRVAAMTGLRRGELCGLRWADVDLEGSRITVRRTITAIDHQPVVGDVKTARSRRAIDVDAATMTMLRAHRKAQLEERMLMGRGYDDQDIVFAMPDGRPWNPETISQAFVRLVAASGLPRIRLHDLRHSHASHLLAVGVNAKVVSERLGHGSVAFTLDTYGHVLPGQQADAAAAAAALVDVV